MQLLPRLESKFGNGGIFGPVVLVEPEGAGGRNVQVIELVTDGSARGIAATASTVAIPASSISPTTPSRRWTRNSGWRSSATQSALARAGRLMSGGYGLELMQRAVLRAWAARACGEEPLRS